MSNWLEVRDCVKEALEIILYERDHTDDDEPIWVLDPAFDIVQNALDVLNQNE